MFKFSTLFHLLLGMYLIYPSRQTAVRTPFTQWTLFLVVAFLLKMYESMRNKGKFIESAGTNYQETSSFVEFGEFRIKKPGNNGEFWWDLYMEIDTAHCAISVYGKRVLFLQLRTCSKGKAPPVVYQQQTTESTYIHLPRPVALHGSQFQHCFFRLKSILEEFCDMH